MSSSLLLLDTKDSINTETPYNGQWYITNPTYNTAARFDISLRGVQFPNTVYPINEYNNAFSVVETTGNTYASTVPAGNYTASTLATALQTAMRAGSGYAGGNAYLVTTDSAAKTFSIVTGTLAVNTFIFVACGNSIYKALGISVSSTPAVTVASSWPYNISGSAYVDVVTSIMQATVTSGASKHIVDRIPLNVPFGYMVFWDPSNLIKNETTASNIDNISISLFDDNGNPFKLPQNAAIAYTFQVSNLAASLDSRGHDSRTNINIY
jgi:hypothetical protein